jgi:hypothetical protein
VIESSVASEANRAVKRLIRVTRLGHFSPIGRLFTFGQTFEKLKNIPNFRATFSTLKFMN